MMNSEPGASGWIHIDYLNWQSYKYYNVMTLYIDTYYMTLY